MCSELGGRELVLCGQVGELAGVGRELVRVAVRRHVVRHDVHARHLVLLFPLHSAILEPDLYLTFRQAEGMRDLDPTPPRQVAVEVELLLQLQRLVPGVRRPLPLRLAVRVHRACGTKFNVSAYSVIACGRCFPTGREVISKGLQWSIFSVYLF